MKSEKFRPYIRRANGEERPDARRGAIRLEFYRLKKRLFYVMVLRGFPNSVMECGATRRDLEFMGTLGRLSFRRWSRQLMELAAGTKKKGGR